jgi:hypothetical protein
MARNDILIPLEIEPAADVPRRSKLAAFVPITLALMGIAAVLLGGISARNHDSAARDAVDPITTGSIEPTQ